MTETQVIDLLREHGIEISMVEGKLRFSPTDLLTDDLKTLIAEHKDELVNHLSAKEDPQEQIDWGGLDPFSPPRGIRPVVWYREWLRQQYAPALGGTLEQRNGEWVLTDLKAGRTKIRIALEAGELLGLLNRSLRDRGG